MTKEKMNEIKNELKIVNGKWYNLLDVDSIQLKCGRGIYPNYKFLRFLFTDDEVLIKHGVPTIYGGKIINTFAISSTRQSISFPPGFLLDKSSVERDFREPKTGDILVISDVNGKFISECIIENVHRGFNATIMTLVNQIPFLTCPIVLSFYDPAEYSGDCAHSTILPWVYIKFVENENGKINKKYGKYQEIIKNKDIESINIRLYK